MDVLLVALAILAGCAPAVAPALDVDVYVHPLAPSLDQDQDGILDHDEQRIGTDPADPDTDGDGVADGDELLDGTDPRVTDSDGDGIEDGDELDQGLDPTDPDTDRGGEWDGDEVADGTDPTDPSDDLAIHGAFVGGGGCLRVRPIGVAALLPLLLRRRVRR